ncbi:MAG: rod shape-determining protein MreC [Bacteroidetes bacterium]|nr:rod shape-determining protein MreC [Bacteroidota bacterium]
MRNLFQLLWKNNFLILFLLLEIFCLYVIVQNQFYQRAVVVNSSNSVVAKGLGYVSNVQQYLYLKKNNDLLLSELEIYRNADMRSFYDVRFIKSEANDTMYKRQYTYTSARVINNSVNKVANYITLDKGSMHGIKRDMGVIGAAGVVGVVKEVSKNYATAISLLHKDSKINGKLKRTGEFGPVLWDGQPAYAYLREIPTSARFNKGDTVITTSFSSIFPEGIMIGTIESAEIPSGEESYSIKIKLATNFHSVSHVLVIDNKFKEEQKSLEFKTDSVNNND